MLCCHVRIPRSPRGNKRLAAASLTCHTCETLRPWQLPPRLWTTFCDSIGYTPKNIVQIYTSGSLLQARTSPTKNHLWEQLLSFPVEKASEDRLPIRPQLHRCPVIHLLLFKTIYNCIGFSARDYSPCLQGSHQFPWNIFRRQMLLRRLPQIQRKLDEDDRIPKACLLLSRWVLFLRYLEGDLFVKEDIRVRTLVVISSARLVMPSSPRFFYPSLTLFDRFWASPRFLGNPVALLLSDIILIQLHLRRIEAMSVSQMHCFNIDISTISRNIMAVSRNK